MVDHWNNILQCSCRSKTDYITLTTCLRYVLDSQLFIHTTITTRKWLRYTSEAFWIKTIIPSNSKIWEDRMKIIESFPDVFSQELNCWRFSKLYLLIFRANFLLKVCLQPVSNSIDKTCARKTCKLPIYIEFRKCLILVHAVRINFNISIYT